MGLSRHANFMLVIKLQCKIPAVRHVYNEEGGVANESRFHYSWLLQQSTISHGQCMSLALLGN